MRALVGQASRSLLTVEEYLGQPATAAEPASAADYIRATRAIAAGPVVAVLPTRVFELAVHTADLTAALGTPAELPPDAATQALPLVTELAVADGQAGALLPAATGRPGGRFTVL